ncbi:MAG TPA: hypothetical protein VLC95_06310, partial [Anaerolineae bacterium]|nr:hypothetical protein [Anaerolineae bacterium]
MSVATLLRLGGLVLILTAVLFAAGGVLAAVVPEGGLATPTVPLLYYLGTISAVLGVIALYTVLREQSGRLGFTGMVLATVGAVLYSGPLLSLLAGTSGATAWHEVWAFAMGNVLLAGPTAFFVGLILLGIATWRGRQLSRGSGLVLAVGAFVWLVAYFLSVVPGLLTVASLVTAAGLAWMGAALWLGRPSRAARQQMA